LIVDKCPLLHNFSPIKINYMKNFCFLLAGILVLSLPTYAQKKIASPRVTAETKNIKVTYGQPSKKGRIIFGKLVPFGEVWRTGANEATEITFATDAVLAGKPVKAGTYTLFTIPTETEWTVILNTTLKQWGAYKYQEIKNNDVLTVKVPVKKLGTVVEKLTYRFTADNLIVEWDQSQIELSITK
jgi:hypothetical protein